MSLGLVLSSFKAKEVLFQRYVAADPQRSGVIIFIVNQNNEPPNFKGYFGVWDNQLAKVRRCQFVTECCRKVIEM